VISCAEAIRHLWAYLDDELDRADRGLVAEHVEACRRCCGEVEFLVELRRFAVAAELDMPAEVGARLEALLSTLEGSHGRSDAQG
jgi:anti-sigma factor RsiW